MPCSASTASIDRQSKRIGHATLDDLPAIFHALVVGTLALWLYYRVVPAHDLVYMQALAFGVLGIALRLRHAVGGEARRARDARAGTRPVPRRGPLAYRRWFARSAPIPSTGWSRWG